jgi:hypothetical protein
MIKIKNFSNIVQKNLETYVYRLIDPRNGETFYVGKGKGNRVFAHVNGEVESDKENEKITRISEIRNRGFNVIHIIHRHGMSEKVALEVEAALIDAYPGLTNNQIGHGSNEFGSMHAEEIIRKYEAKEAKISHNLISININRSIDEMNNYDATRIAWKVDPKRASKCDYVIAVEKGIIVDVFIAEKWLAATPQNFPIQITIEKRWGFVGKEAPPKIRDQYIGKSIPAKYRKQGAANPIKYINK